MHIRFSLKGKTTKLLGEVFSRKCGVCKTEDLWLLYKTNHWLSINYIPIFVYFSEKTIVCQGCFGNLAINDEVFKLCKAIIRINDNYDNNKISELKYNMKINEVLSELEKKGIFDIINNN